MLRVLDLAFRGLVQEIRASWDLVTTYSWAYKPLRGIISRVMTPVQVLTKSHEPLRNCPSSGLTKGASQLLIRIGVLLS